MQNASGLEQCNTHLWLDTVRPHWNFTTDHANLLEWHPERSDNLRTSLPLFTTISYWVRFSRTPVCVCLYPVQTCFIQMFDRDISRALQSKENRENQNSKRRISKASKKNSIFRSRDILSWSLSTRSTVLNRKQCWKNSIAVQRWVSAGCFFRRTSEVTQGSMLSPG